MKMNNAVLFRILEKVVVNDKGCWVYQTSSNNDWYAVIAINGKPHRIHTIMYIFYKGEVPEGKEVDHTCENKPCGNPEHLEAVTHRENMLRSNTIIAQELAQTTCPLGHPYSGKNNRGNRICHTCSAANARRYRREKHD